MQSCRFINNYALENGGALYFSDSLEILIDSCYFFDNSALYKGSEVYTFSSSYTLKVINSNFEKSSKASAIYCESTQLEVYNTGFNTNYDQAIQGAGITCINCKNLTLKNSNFKNLNSTKGGAVYIEQIDAIKIGDTFYIIEYCEFLNNYAF